MQLGVNLPRFVSELLFESLIATSCHVCLLSDFQDECGVESQYCGGMIMWFKHIFVDLESFGSFDHLMFVHIISTMVQQFTGNLKAEVLLLTIDN